MDYYVVPILEDEKRESIMIHIDSNDINKTVHDNVNSEDLAQQIVNTAKKCRSFGANNIAISSILMRKNVRITKLRKLTRRFPVCVQQMVFILYIMRC